MDKIMFQLKQDYDGLETVIKVIQALHNTTEIPIFFNGFMFFRLTFIDIIGVVKQLTLAKDKQLINLLNRNLAVHLYEFLDDTPDFTGKTLRNSLTFLSDELTLVKDLYKLKEVYEAVYKNCNKYLSDIRHSTGAHKEQNSFVLNEKIKNTDYDNLKTYTIFCLLLFALIVQFQSNVLHSIISDYNSLPTTTDKVPNDIKVIRIDHRFKEFIYLVQGMNPVIAEWVSKMSDEEVSKTKTILESLQEAITLKSKKV